MLQTHAFLVINSGGDDFWLVTLALLGVAGGVLLFLKGFRMLQYKRLILNTPFSKIRSASIGLVEVSGMARGPQTISAAITGQACYYYRARAWQFTESDKGSSWAQVTDESLFVPFFLEDGTGRVLVSPQGAQLDVHRSFSDELHTSSFGKNNVIPENIRNFVIRRGLLAGDKIRLEEQIIKPDFPLFVFGTLGDNPGLTSWTPMSHTRSVDISFGSSTNPLSSFGRSATLNFNFKTAGPGIVTRAMTQMQVKGTSDGAPVVLPDGVMESLNRMGIPLPASVLTESASLAPGPQAAANSHTATAVVDSPVTSQTPSGASTESKQPPDPRYDLHARVAISKGGRGDPFTISSQSQREVVKALAWKSTLYIWGSPIFALVCIYFLIVYWSWM